MHIYGTMISKYANQKRRESEQSLLMETKRTFPVMPSYHPDFIVSCQRRKNELRCLLAAVKNAEHYARIRPGSDTANTLDFHNDNLAAFMYRNCGFPKGEPAPEPTYVRPSFEQAQHWFNDVICSIPLGGSR